MEKNKKHSFRPLQWLKRMLGLNRRELSFAEEEALQSPLRMIIKKFFANKLSRFGFITFVLVFLFVMLGPYFVKIDLSHQDNTQLNVPPGYNMMRVPKELNGKIRKIAPGTTFALGVSEEGRLFLWGQSKITDQIDLKNIPKELNDVHIVDIAVGYDHAVALDEKGKLYTWGNTRLGQDNYPKAIADAMRKNENIQITQMEAGSQFTVALDSSGRLHVRGNENINDIKIRKAVRDLKYKDISVNVNNFLALTEDGQVIYPGRQKNAFSSVPEGLDKDVVDIASTSFTNAALKSDGSVVVWGNSTKGENLVPKSDGKIIQLFAGRYHYTALTDTGKLISWGDNAYDQATVPSFGEETKLKDLFVGYYQNYAVDSTNKLHTWGLKGYLFGTDHLGRDILVRIINGGKVTMTVGAVSVIISLIIGVTLGGLAGYFGGHVDMFIMRLSEIIGGLPFLPFALILSAIIGNTMAVEQRMYLIMVVLGVLSWPPLCRLVRAQILAQREMEFVTAAKAMGVRELSIVFKHIVPNVISVILVSATLSFATSMLTESTLSYLGFGIAPPTPTWGNMLKGANDSIVIQQYWWRWVFPAAIFSVCTICINLIGDGLREAIDPKSNER